ncbi:hypothetical protein INH39_25510 [Massilia violaceinigra]|uniref:DUF3149 domain-containing protein n=1 Tax=Massilia violaceinigra TaxID=2045208 RepID=A0ABY4A510_9BURK|nr:hypothetical protein [Massilia violaceinigra]UOD28769.1 hypothetical protein INH39_25510 [Massilia violaceinigra]
MLNEIEFLTAFALTIVAVIVILAVVLSIAALVNASMDSATRREYKRGRL